MTVDEAIKRYIDNAEYERTHGNLQGCLEFKQLAEWLKELKQLREQTRWIPVSERLPDIHNYCMKYLVTDCHRHIHTSLFTESNGKSWWSHSDVIAWMPLPKPYVPDTNVGDKTESEG